MGTRTRAGLSARRLGLGDARPGRRRHRRVPRRPAYLVPERADPLPARRRATRPAAAGAAGAGRRARAGLAAAAPQRRTPPRRPGRDGNPPAPGRPARAPPGRARTTAAARARSAPWAILTGPRRRSPTVPVSFCAVRILRSRLPLYLAQLP